MAARPKARADEGVQRMVGVGVGTCTGGAGERKLAGEQGGMGARGREDTKAETVAREEMRSLA